jgi:hypothetical protein
MYGSTLFSIPTITQTVTTMYIVVTVCVIVGILKRVDPYIVVTVCVIVGILKRVDPYIVVTVCVIAL